MADLLFRNAKALPDFINHHPVLAYEPIFLIPLFESLAIVGLFIPGTVFMFGAGAIVVIGSLGLKPVFLLLAAGEVAGDWNSCWLGSHNQQKLRRIWPFCRYPGMLKIGEIFSP